MVLRVEAYLRIACSVLGFEIGELWCARNIIGQAPSLRFIQLYTSPTYEEFHRILVNSENANTSGNASATGDSKHRFSPIICRGVCDGGQIVWANTRISNGFIGCTDLPLNTAVGLPVCSIGADLCIIILYSVPVMHISPNAVEFLCSITRAASEGEGGFLPNITATPISPPMTEQFVGVWDMAVFISKYAKDVDFQLLPLNQLQGYIDFQERVAFKELFEDFKQKRDGRFTAKQIESLRQRNMDEMSIASSDAVSIIDEKEDISGPGAFTVDLEQSSDSSGAANNSNINDNNDDDNSVNNSTTDRNNNNNNNNKNMQSNVHNASHASDWYSSLKSGDELAAADTSMRRTSSTSSIQLSYAPIDARYSYKKHRERFHEFMVAALGMTIFDAAELWLLSDRSSELNVVAALHRDGDMQVWTAQSKDLGLAKGQDVPGQVLMSDYPIWDHNYNHHKDEEKRYPRAAAAADIGVRTAFGVPLPGPSGAVGVLMLYSKREVDTEPLVVTLVLKAAQLLSACALGLGPLTQLDIENIIHSPKATIYDWLHDERSEGKNGKLPYLAPVSSGYHPGTGPGGIGVSVTVTGDEVTASSGGDSNNNNDNDNDHHGTDGREQKSNYEEETGAAMSSSSFGGCTLMTLEAGPSSSSSSTSKPAANYSINHHSAAMQQQARSSQHWEQTRVRLPGSFSTNDDADGIPDDDHFRHYMPDDARSPSSSYHDKNSNNPMYPVPGSWTSHLHAVGGYPMNSGGGGGQNARPSATVRGSITGHHQQQQQQAYWSSQGSSSMPMGSMSMEGHWYHQQQQMLPQGMQMMSAGMNSTETNIGNYMGSHGMRPDPHHAISNKGYSHGRSELSAYSGSENELIYSKRAAAGKLLSSSASTTVDGRKTNYYDHHMEENLKSSASKPTSDDEYGQGGGGYEGSKCCKYEGCTSLASKRSPYCVTHTGTRRCQWEGCTKCAQGSTKYCIAHGGGRRCTFPGCSKGARDKHFCAGHGGGKRCKIGDCKKSAVGGSKLCTAHGGGKRCQAYGCTKSAQSSTPFCVRHGGGRKCRIAGCNKVARGKTEYCAAHGGGMKCRAEGCMKAAAGRYFYCKEHLQKMDAKIDNLDEIEEDEIFHGVIMDEAGDASNRKRHLSDEDEDDDDYVEICPPAKKIE